MVITLLCLIAAVIVIYFTWNYYNERKSRPIWPIEKDIRYYELKSKYEFLVATGSLFTILIIFMGLNTQKDLEVKLRNEYRGLLDSAANLKSDVDQQLKNSREGTRILTNDLAHLNGIVEDITQKSSSSLKSFKYINEQYAQISKRPILNKEIITIQEIVYREADEGNKYYYKDLQTVDGLPLPKFNAPPTVLANGINGGTFGIIRVTHEYAHVINVGGVEIHGDPPTLPLRLRLVLFVN